MWNMEGSTNTTVDAENKYIRVRKDLFIPSEDAVEYFTYLWEVDGLIFNIEQLHRTIPTFLKPNVQSNYVHIYNKHNKPCQISVLANTYGLCINNFTLEDFIPKWIVT